MTITLRVRRASLFVSASGGMTLIRMSGAQITYVFLSFTYIFWCAVCGMPGVLPGATEVEDGSFHAEIVLQRSCRYLWRKGREMPGYECDFFRSNSSTTCGATCGNKDGYTPVSFLYSFMHLRTAVKQISSFLMIWRCFRFVFMRRISAPLAPTATFIYL